MTDVVKYGLYFVLGGLLVSLSTYVGAMGRGFLAAFASTFPAITGMTFVLIYVNGGAEHTLSYAKHLLWFVPPWLAYVGFIIVALPRLGFWPAMLGGLTLYMMCVGLLRLVLR
ncbi:DUF3147 domain-containing protein [Candidatus Nitrospira bockiana]